MEIGAIEILQPLGRGAGSTIFKVRRRADGQIYALKVVGLDPRTPLKFVEQAELEFRVAGHLKHPYLIRAFAFEKTRRWFRVTGARLLLEFVDGLPLSQCGTLPLVRLVSIFFKSADGLTYLHDHGWLHADMKPDNIMVAGPRDVKIIDLGLAWQKGEQKGRVQGTLDFLAPEQARRKIVNERTEVFNFGATMYNVLTGKSIPAAFRESEARGLGGLDQLVQRADAMRADLPQALTALVHQCIRYEPKERPRAMQQVRDELRQIGKQLKESQPTADIES